MLTTPDEKACKSTHQGADNPFKKIEGFQVVSILQDVEKIAYWLLKESPCHDIPEGT